MRLLVLGIIAGLCGWAGIAPSLAAQRPVDISSLRNRFVSAATPFQIIDTLTVGGPLLSVFDSATGRVLDRVFFSLENKYLHIDTARLYAVCPACHTLRIVYRVLPFDLSTPIRRLDTLAIRQTRPGEPDIAFDYAPYEPVSKAWETNGLHSTGAYTRGLSFGNNQNLVFNSNLNLQLNGRLGTDIELAAALSDNSVPLQPDGTTRQLKEFDRIFIQLKRKNTALTAGDFDLTKPTGYFSNYFKRVQGAMVVSDFKIPRLDTRRLGVADQVLSHAMSIRAAGAISRGKFARQSIQGQEGNQGPYRLQGSEGERFIIVLAGTEKVFVDGQQLRRGLQDDYIVDYNLGELSFTARRLITKDSRIIVEFEYAVQTYLRSTLATNVEWKAPRARTWFNFYSEQDSRNNSSAGEQSLAERQRLAEVGDQLRNAYASGIDTLADFDASRVLYRYGDTLVCGLKARVLVYSTDPKVARYAVRFSEVPQGQGNYVQALTSANGRVFRWVSPDPTNCQPRGNFEPVVRLIAPELRQLHTVGTEIQPFKNGIISFEGALSNRDLNRFSPLGNADNLGGAVFAGFRQQFNLRGDKALDSTSTSPPRVTFSIYGNYEYTARQFSALNPYRSSEFVRDWNVSNVQDTATEQVAKVGITTLHRDWGEGRYELSSYQRQGLYQGLRHFGQMRIQRNGWELFAEGNFLKTDGFIERSQFSRPKVDFSKTFFQKKAPASLVQPPPSSQQSSAALSPLFKVGLYAERERNQRTAVGVDTLSRTSFWYDLYRAYFQTLDKARTWQIGGSLTQRNDFFPTGNFFKQNTAANEANVNGGWQRSSNGQRARSNQQLSWNLTYRTLHVLEPTLTDQRAQKTYLGRADYSLSAGRNALNLTSGYELGSGQSPKTEFNYVRVNPGEGQFTWVDRNRDSILQVDEMEIAVFQDQASYVRVALATTDYIRTNNVLFNQSLRLDPQALWSPSKQRWKRIGSHFSTQSTLQINRRTFAKASGVSAWNPFQLSVPDSALVTIASTVRNVLFVNRAKPGWDASVAQGDNRNQVALTTGFEQRRNQDYTLHGRVSIHRRWSTEADITQGERSSDHQVFNTRDFAIRYWEAGPKLSWLPDRTFRWVFNFNIKNSQNKLGNGEKASQNEWNTELTWNPQARRNGQGFQSATSLRARGTFTHIRYTGSPNTAVAFTMLEGLQDGRNFQWSLTLDRQLSKSIQLNLNYEGRKTGDNRVIHIGRAQVRAVF